MLKQAVLDNIKNIYGWKTNKKIIVFSVDDYGNVRLGSKKAREKMDKEGLKIKTRFDSYDTLETKDDLEVLFETLMSVKDKNGRNAVFTPFALPCNINFEKMEAEGNKKYMYELLPETYQKLAGNDVKAYNGAWKLWQEGIEKGLMVPQFHGREHLNLKVFEEKLAQKDHQVLTSLKNRSYTSIFNSGYDTLNYTAAFDFWDVSENESLKGVIVDGLKQFEKVFGYKAIQFMPPTSKIHKSLFPVLFENGIRYIDTNLIHKQHQGFGNYTTSINYTGKKTNSGQIYTVRNVVFEPTNNASSIDIALKQIEAAFRWKRPAIISSHRVNFCGHIELKNRQKGIGALKELLHKIIRKWPDVEFMSANELGDLMLKAKK